MKRTPNLNQVAKAVRDDWDDDEDEDEEEEHERDLEEDEEKDTKAQAIETKVDGTAFAGPHPPRRRERDAEEDSNKIWEEA